MIMKIALIEPKPPINVYFFLTKLPLLGNLFLGTMLKNAGHEVKVFKEDIIPVYNVKNDSLHPFLKEADIIGITAITHTAGRAYQIADAIKRQFPAKKVILGGNHPSAVPNEALEHADQVVVGEGENVVLDVFEGRNTDRIIQGTRVNIDDVPIMDLSLLQGYGVKGLKLNMKYAPLMASRGCPHDCIFCSVTQMFGRKYRIKNADIVMEEVMMRYREGFRHGFFYDDNFAANHEKTKIFLEKLIRADLDFQWSSQFSTHVAKDIELVRMLKRAKCVTLFIGVESINPEALKDYHKSHTVQMVKDSVSSLVKEGMNVHSMFILGADSDTEKTMDKTIRFAKESGSRTAQFSILFPIPGTKLYDQMMAANRIFINDWNYYDGSHCVILPKNVSLLALQKKLIQAYRKFYSKNALWWLAAQVGFFVWKIINKKYMKYIRHFSRKLKLEGVVQDGVLTIAGLRSDAIPRVLPEVLTRK
jgi:anaerobic magnesium-protoporphyrin IX monomethyl ester cyclase